MPVVDEDSLDQERDAGQVKLIKEIARDPKISRNNVSKVMRSSDEAFTDGRAVWPLPKLRPWSNDLVALRTEDDRQARPTLVRIYEPLR